MQPDLEQIKNYLKSFMEELEKDEGVDFVILPTENEEHGFWGELKEVDIPEELLQTYWNIISEHLQSECDMSPELTRDFLDSKAGRYLVDDLERNEPEDERARQQKLAEKEKMLNLPTFLKNTQKT